VCRIGLTTSKSFPGKSKTGLNARKAGHMAEILDVLPCKECDYSHPPVSSEWCAPSWVNNYIWWPHPYVPVSIYTLVEQIYSAALQHDAYWLAAMGIRGVLDLTMIEKIGDTRTFEEKVVAFQKAGYLSVRQALNLNILIEAGHAAVHRQWAPSPCEIATLLDITNSIIETAYLHEKRVRDLERNVPEDPRRKLT
jgi:hypothetical protein